VAGADPLPGGERLARWLASGAHGDMHYLERTACVRADPAAFLPGARSVVVGALSYHEDGEADAPQPPPDRVQVARYACRRDYHVVLRRRMIRLGRTLGRLAPGAVWRVAVDTGPVLEKELAHRAGLGWIGRNTLLIHPELGSHLLLGVLITDVPLTPSTLQADRCGDCMACVKACPTGAIGPDRRLEAQRCLSYLTLEHSAELAGELRKALGAWLAGCDLCQQVCPWNRTARATANPSLPLRTELTRLTASRLATMGPEAWRELAAGTPLTRLGFDRFQRNLEVIRSNLESHGPGA